MLMTLYFGHLREMSIWSSLFSLDRLLHCILSKLPSQKPDHHIRCASAGELQKFQDGYHACCSCLSVMHWE